MTDQELIELLRRMSPRLDMLDCENVLTAADRIAELEKEIEVLHKEVRLLEIGFDASQAKLTKAVEALVQLERIVGDILGAHLQDSESRDKAIDLIKTTLAELEGEG